MRQSAFTPHIFTNININPFGRWPAQARAFLRHGETKRKACIIKNPKRLIGAREAIYFDHRENPVIERVIKAAYPNAKIIRQATVGLKFLYALFGRHSQVAAVHKTQAAGLWDILPAAVAARAFKARLLDGNGEQVQFGKYFMLPGNGAAVIRGGKLLGIQKILKRMKMRALKSPPARRMRPKPRGK